jgi:hypothetical protein
VGAGARGAEPLPLERVAHRHRLGADLDGLAAGNRAGLGYPDPGLRSEEFDAAARYLKENRLVTGHTDLRLTAAGAEEARRLKG